MGDTVPSVITHAARTKVVVIREDYIRICQVEDMPNSGACCCAYLLSVFDFWTYVLAHSRQRAQRINETAAANGEDGGQITDLWIWKTTQELADESLGMFSERTIRTWLPLLVEKGYLKERNNPRHSWDRTKQYLFNWPDVQRAVNALRPGGDEPPTAGRVAGPKPGNAPPTGHSVNLPEAYGETADTLRQELHTSAANLPPQDGETAGAIPESLFESLTESLIETEDGENAAGFGMVIAIAPKTRKRPTSDYHCLMEMVAQITGGIVNYAAEGKAANEILALSVTPPVRPDEVAACLRHWIDGRDVAKYGSSLHVFKKSFPTLLQRLRQDIPLDGSSSAAASKGMAGVLSATEARIRAKEQQARGGK